MGFQWPRRLTGRKLGLRMRRSAALLVLAILSVTSSRADEPVVLKIEGRLRTTGGPHAASDVDVTFRLVDRPNGGDILWSQGPQAVSLRDGFFRAILGGGDPPLTPD